MKKNEIINKIPKNEVIELTFIEDETNTYIITNKEKKYFLYLIVDNCYQFLKSRTGDPLFKECYEGED